MKKTCQVRTQESRCRGTQPLFIAVMKVKEDPEAGLQELQDVISTAPDVDAKDVDGFTPLMYAVRLDLPSVVPVLAEAGASVDSKDEDGCVPLYYACLFRNWEVAKELVRHGANPDGIDSNGYTVLLNAIDVQHRDLIDGVLALGASPNTCSLSGISPLAMCLSHKHLPSDPYVLTKLLEAGADPNQCDSDGVSPLILSSASARTVVGDHAEEILVQAGAVIDLQDCTGKTALHHACIAMKPSVARMLLDAGANTKVTDHEGHTPLDLVRKALARAGPSDATDSRALLDSLQLLLLHFDADRDSISE